MNFAKHWAATLDDYVIDLAWSPDGRVLAAAAQSGAIQLLSAGTGEMLHALPGHEDGTNAIAWLPNSSILVSGGQDGAVRLWDAASGAMTAEAKFGSAWVEHLQATESLIFAAAGRKLAVLRADGTIAHTFPEIPKTISALALGPVHVAAAYFGGASVWDAKDFSKKHDYTYGNSIHALVWSPDGRWLVAGCQDNAVHLWAPAEDLELHMSGYETKLKELSFSDDSRWLATGGGRDACVWDCSGDGPEGREPTLLPHTARTVAVAYQNSHSLLATAAANGEFCLWATSRKNPLIAEVKMPAPATKFAWRPDDSLLAVGTEQGQVFVFKTGV